MQKTSTASILNKLWYLIPIIGIFMLLMCEPAHGQNKKDTITATNGIISQQAVWNYYIDSVVSRLSLKQFQEWLFENATVKQYNDGKFVDFYNSYINWRYDIWVKEWNDKHQKPKKP